MAATDAVAKSPGLIVTDLVGADDWQEVADRCEYATFFHTPAWFLAFSRTTTSLKIATKRFEFSDGLVAILPLMEHRPLLSLSRQYLMGPAGCYGGWISADELMPEHIQAMTDWVLRGLPSLVWRLNPLDDNTRLISRRLASPDTTEMMAIGELESETTLLQSYKRSVRKEIRKAEKEGFSTDISRDWSDWEEYYSLYEKALLRWGDKATSRYRLALFSELFEAHSSNIKLWIIRRADEIIGGNLNFYHNRHCVEWHAAFDSRFFGSGARNLLVHRIMLDAMDRGYTFYDFNPSGGHEGTRAFKKSFGTSEISTDVIRTEKRPRFVSIAEGIAGLLK